jgi:hypothetical protein
MMSEYTSLTSHLEVLKAERRELDFVDIDALVDERLAEVKSKIKQEVVAEVASQKFVAEIKIDAIEEALQVVARAREAEKAEVVESSEIIND